MIELLDDEYIDSCDYDWKLHCQSFCDDNNLPDYMVSTLDGIVTLAEVMTIANVSHKPNAVFFEYIGLKYPNDTNWLNRLGKLKLDNRKRNVLMLALGIFRQYMNPGSNGHGLSIPG